eukprot:8718192-Lingulodinium_polyedra.AAC.1
MLRDSAATAASCETPPPRCCWRPRWNGRRASCCDWPTARLAETAATHAGRGQTGHTSVTRDKRNGRLRG